jgi:hypothetical protein
MAPLTDPELLNRYLEALREWEIEGFVGWKRRAAEWLRLNLEDQTQKSVARAMYEHVQAGREVDQVKERRHGHQDNYEFHFDLRFTLNGRRVYIETTLDNTRTGPMITIVNMKDE